MTEEQERKSFERHLSLSGVSLGKRNDDGEYIARHIESLWLGWAARAALSQPASPVPEAHPPWCSGGCCNFAEDVMDLVDVYAESVRDGDPQEHQISARANIDHLLRSPVPEAMTTAERVAWVRGHSVGWDAALKNEADAGGETE